MGLADELKKLEDLHRFGTLTAEEFAKAKAALLAATEAAAAVPGDGIAESLAAQLAEMRYRNELARIDREWEIEKEQYMVTDKYRRRHIPTAGAGRLTAIFGGVFGALWMSIAIGMTSGGLDFGAFSVAKLVFPLFGVLFIAIAVGYGIYYENKAAAYQKALAAYKARRAAVLPEDFR